MRPSENMDKLIKKLRYKASAEAHDRVLGNVMQALDESQRIKSAALRPNIRRTIMKGPIPKLAAAAAVIMVGAAVLLVMTGIGENVALAEVLEQIEQLEAFTYKMKMNMANVPGMPAKKTLKMNMNTVIAKDIGMLMTAHMDSKLISETYIILDEKVILSIIPEQKQYMRITLTGEMFEKMQKDNGDPRAIVKQFTKNEYTELGRSVVDGIEVEGFESADPNIVQNVLGNVVGRLWVDVETKLPVRFDIEVLGENGETMTDMTVYGFEWGVEVEPDVFIPTIPDDYKLMAEVELAGDEKSVIEGLGFFSEFTGGKYPSDLNMVKTMQEFSDATVARFGSSQSEPPKEEYIQKLMSLQMAGSFYITLAAEGKDPAYYGSKVTAEFPDAVLMRWKLDDGTYKIIFGDLTIGEATAEELEKLESAPLNQKPTAIKPDPPDGTEGASLTELKLSWMPGAYVTNHKVYFGTDPGQPALLGEVTTEYAEPATLQRGVTYYWRIDEVQPDGSIATGDIWSFNTGQLVAHWKLDEASGDTATDATGNNWHGKLAGAPLWTTGKIGGALQFDSNDYVEIIDSNCLAVTNQITVSAWIKVGAFDKNWQAIVTKGDRSWRLQRRRGTNSLEFACSGLIVPDSMWGSLYGTVDVNDGQWHHAAGVYDGQKIYLYVDGKLDVSKEASGKIRIDDKPVFIGENSQVPGRSWNGLIDDVRIYSYGMSDEEIAALSKQ